MINMTINNRKIEAKPGHVDPRRRPGRGGEDPHPVPHQGSVPQRRLPDVRGRGQGQAHPDAVLRIPRGGRDGGADAQPARDQRAAHDHPAPAGQSPLRLPHLPEERLLRAAVPVLRVRDRPRALQGQDAPPLHRLLLARPSSASPTSASSAAAACASARRSRAWRPSTSRGAASTPWSCLPSRWTSAKPPA